MFMFLNLAVGLSKMHTLIVDSRNRSSDETPSNFTFDAQQKSFTIKSINFPKCIKPISAARKTNELTFENSIGWIYTVTIPDGFYSIRSFCRALQSEMFWTDKSPWAYLTLESYKVKYYSESRHIRISNWINSFRLHLGESNIYTWR